MLSDNSDIKCYACLELLGKIENPSHFVRENCLVECAKRNNIIAVINLLESGIDIETSDIDGMTSLCWAVQLQNVALVSYLISKGANTNVFCKANFDTPVSLACKVGNIAILHLLLQNGGDSEYRDPRGVTLLMSAAASKQPLICEYLIRRGMILGEDNFGHSALHWASSHGDPSVISLLLHHFPESINIKDLNQMTPLHYAVARGRISATQILLENGADLNLLDINGNNPCALAIQKYSEEVSKMQRSFFATLMNKLTGQKKEPQIISMIKSGKIYKKKENSKYGCTLAQIIFLTFFMIGLIYTLAYLIPWKNYYHLIHLFTRNKKDTDQLSSINIFILIISLSLLTIGMISFSQWVLLSNSNPGRLLNQLKDNQFKDLQEQFTDILDRGCNQEEQSIIQSLNDKCLIISTPITLCYTCRIPRPLRSKHCTICGSCITHMDHHCQWLRTCVGDGNKKLFFIFLHLMLLTLIIYILLAFLVYSNESNSPIIIRNVDRSLENNIQQDSISTLNGLNIKIIIKWIWDWCYFLASCHTFGLFVLASASFFGLFLFTMIISQHMQILNDVTTNEIVNAPRYMIFKTLSGGFSNPYYIQRNKKINKQKILKDTHKQIDNQLILNKPLLSQQHESKQQEYDLIIDGEEYDSPKISYRNLLLKYPSICPHRRNWFPPFDNIFNNYKHFFEKKSTEQLIQSLTFQTESRFNQVGEECNLQRRSLDERLSEDMENRYQSNEVALNCAMLFPGYFWKS